VRLTEKLRRRGGSNGPEDDRDRQAETLTFEPRQDRKAEPAAGRERPHGGPTQTRATSYESGKLFALGDDGQTDLVYAPASSARDFTRFQERLMKGRVKLCVGCGGVMAKASRMIFSPLAGLLLIMLGTLMMTFYGLATNFYQTPWFVKFILPALYYIGSIFIGIGTIFFFIREKVWKCDKCREIRKR